MQVFKIICNTLNMNRNKGFILKVWFAILQSTENYETLKTWNNLDVLNHSYIF
jgi:hypothetical protein